MVRKTAFFEPRLWFKFNNLGLVLDMNLKFYTNLAKGLKLKTRRFWGLVPMFVEVRGEKTSRGGLFSLSIFLRELGFSNFVDLLNISSSENYQGTHNSQINSQDSSNFHFHKTLKLLNRKNQTSC